MGVSNPQVGDLNADGNKDLICGERDGYIKYFERNTDSTLKAPVNMKLGGTVYSVTNSSPVLVDWDEDGLLDIFANGSNNRAYIYRNSGTPQVPNFSTKTEVLIAGSSIDYNRQHFQIADLNKDGKKDLIYGTGLGSTGFYFVENTGTNKAPQFSKAAVRLKNTSGQDIPGSQNTHIEIADFNSDGGFDLLWFDSNGYKLHIYQGTVPTTGSNEVPAELSFSSRLDIYVTDGSIYLSNITGNVSYSLFTMDGRKIAEGIGIPGSYKNRIELKSFSQGVYFLRTCCGNDINNYTILY